MLRAVAATALLALGIGLAAATSASAASLEPVGNFDEPIYVTSDPGDAGGLFVVERGGTIKQVREGVVTPFADLTAEVGCEGSTCPGERGLLSVALAPDFDESGRLFVDYSAEADGAIHIAELVAKGDTAPSSSLRPVLTIPHEDSKEHYAGQLQFGPEGDLFISVGDGGAYADELHRAQDLGSLLGKILRIDVGSPIGYAVPADNPFAGATPPFDTIWSYGLRNPFRFSFDRGGSGIWIGDVGQGSYEEIDHGAAPGLGAGADYGWNCFEGLHPGPSAYRDPRCATPPASGYVDPVFEYPHAEDTVGAHGCAVIGGYVVRDPALGSLYGRYLYGDLCTGQLRSFSPSSPASTDCYSGVTVPSIDSFGEDAAGHLYTASGHGAVSRLVGAAATPCVLQGSRAGIKAFSRTVRRGKRALITVWTSPCTGRQGERILLYRGRVKVGGRKLGRACTARFHPRIRRRSSFQARIAADNNFQAARSRRLTIKPVRHKVRARKGHRRQSPQ